MMIFASTLIIGALAVSPILVQFDLLNLKDGRSGSVLVKVNPSDAPIGAARFLELVESDFFTDARFFRCVKNFVVQFGLAADPKLTARCGC
jgi:hypothetical protein